MKEDQIRFGDNGVAAQAGAVERPPFTSDAPLMSAPPLLPLSHFN